MLNNWAGLTYDYGTTPGGKIYPGAEVDRLHGIINSQVQLGIDESGTGILWWPSRTSLEVTNQGGLNIGIKAGRAIVRHSAQGGARVEVGSNLGPVALEPDTTTYVFVALDVRTENDSRVSAQPSIAFDPNPTMDGGVPLARVVTGAATITSITDLRIPVRFQDVDIAGQDVVTSLAGNDKLLAFNTSANKNVSITKANAESDLVHKSQNETMTGAKTFDQFLAINSSSPASLTSHQNNYALGTAPVVRLASDASRNITGLAATSKKLVTLVNVGSNPIVLMNQNASSTAANRILVPGGNDLTLSPDYAATLWYDDSTARWRVWQTWAVGGSSSPWRSGTGVPSNALGADGDFYLDETSGNYYQKQAGAYLLKGNLKGPAGATGEPGPPGADGGIISTLARSDAVAATATLAHNATGNLTVELGRISLLIRVSTSHAARVRLYRTAAQRTADAARPIGIRPVGNHGLIFEGVTTVGTLNIDVLRELLAANAESPPVADMPIAVTNLSGGAQAITVTINKSTVQD